MVTATVNYDIGTSPEVTFGHPRVEGKIAADLYKWLADRARGTDEQESWVFGKNGQTWAFILPADIYSVGQVFGSAFIRTENLEAIKLLDEWFAEPDNLGEAFWEEYEKQLEGNKFTIP